MKKQNYYVGLDIGTDSVGYAVTDEQYNLCKSGGEPMWGVTLFDEAQLAVERRAFRVARRRLDRRQQRLHLLSELFAYEVSVVDKDFFKRIQESYKYPENVGQKVRLFGTYEEQKAYMVKYPTVHHLIDDLMCNAQPHDVRLVYIACAWLVAHRGHFLSEVNKYNVDAVTNFDGVYCDLVEFIKRDECELPWNEDIDVSKIENVLKTKLGITKKAKALSEVLFGGKAPKAVDDTHKYNYDLVIKVICGGKANLKDLFDVEKYEDLEEKSVALNMDDEKLLMILQSIDEDDAEFIRVLKAVYDWSVLVDVLKSEKTISKAKIAVYEQHQRDLRLLKRLIKKYAADKYNDVFRSETVKNNYVSYIGKNQTANKDVKVKKATNKEEFCKYILSVVKTIKPDNGDAIEYQNMITRLEVNDFLPKQVDGDNRVIPYQLYWHELNTIIENAKNYIPFLREKDDDGITGAEKVLAIFEFRVPYYVGPLKENREKNKKLNHWMVRKAEGKVYPWNFNNMVDLDSSEESFIARMTNTCTYLPGEDVLPKNSLVYCAFEVLNEINNIKINGKDIPVTVKQNIYENVFMQYDKVTPKLINKYMIANGYAKEDDIISGIDISVKSSLKPFRAFRRLVANKLLSYSDAESIITRATYSEDKARYKKWLCDNYPNLPESEIKYISGLKFKEFGRLSKKLLCGIEGAVNKETGEYMSIIRTMWETNLNFMQIMFASEFDFERKVREYAKEYYGKEGKNISERLDEMYVSNAVKRPIIRTLDILKDVVKVQGQDPKTIFIEMARGTKEDQKGKRTVTRLKQIMDLYDKVDKEDVRVLRKQLEEWGDAAHNKLQSDKLFLYFIQLGKCLYTGKEIGIESVIAGDGVYNIEHIYPRSFVKDDSVINNKILVDSKANGEKGDIYPINADIQNKMRTYWMHLNKIGLMSDEKLKRLTRTTGFTDEEKFEFINRQLVETRQSTKAVATLLKELYPDTEIVYVKAGLVSDFRHEFDLVKSRAVNDLHHAKDAYLNIVCGNVWHHKFSRQFWRAGDPGNNAKPEIVFTRPLVCGGKMIWNGAEDKDRVVKTARKNTAHMTKYSFCRKGGFFDQMPVPASAGLVPLKKDMPTDIYGGYNKTTATFFVLVRYTSGKNKDVLVMPVELLYAEKFIGDDVFAREYAIKTIGEITNKPVGDVEFVLGKRTIKVNTMLSLDGMRICITGKSGGGRQLGVSNMNSFKVPFEIERYIKKLESFDEKRSKNKNIVFDEKHDVISTEKNLELYDIYVEKLQKAPYKYRPANPYSTLVGGREKFKALPADKQVSVLLAILGLFGRAIKADLTLIGGVPSAGVAALSSSMSNWKKNYTDVRIIDQSASGLFEKTSDNLLDLI